MPSEQLINPLKILNTIGRQTIDIVNHMGAVVIFFSHGFVRIFRKKQWRQIVQQIYYIGATSSAIVAVVGLFTGMVLGLQLYYTLIKFGSVGVVGAAVSLSIIRELGPVLMAIMITARAGSAMTAEIGIQRISEQIDALYTMRIDPVKFLISPRIAASIISFPILTAFFDLLGILGGWFSAVLLLGVNEGAYFHRVRSSLEMIDIQGGFIKRML
ncbi:MAG: ABC transporter permease [Proteobacteria bacterium]|nr:ABC transporter permease [Pseudomonadota bacterium]